MSDRQHLVFSDYRLFSKEEISST